MFAANLSDGHVCIWARRRSASVTRNSYSFHCDRRTHNKHTPAALSISMGSFSSFPLAFFNKCSVHWRCFILVHNIVCTHTIHSFSIKCIYISAWLPTKSFSVCLAYAHNLQTRDCLRSSRIRNKKKTKEANTYQPDPWVSKAFLCVCPLDRKMKSINNNKNTVCHTSNFVWLRELAFTQISLCFGGVSSFFVLQHWPCRKLFPFISFVFLGLNQAVHTLSFQKPAISIAAWCGDKVSQNMNNIKAEKKTSGRNTLLDRCFFFGRLYTEYLGVI